MADPVVIKVKFDSREAEQDAQKFNAGMVKSFAVGAVAAQAAIAAFKLLGDAIKGSIDFAGESVQAASEAEQVNIKLAGALKARGEFTKANLKALQDDATAIQRVTTLGDEFVKTIQSQLLNLGAHNDRLSDATRAVIGFTEAGVGQETAVRAVAQLLRGEAAPMLKRYGIEHQDVNRALEQGLALFEQSKDRASTFTGRITQLTEAWGDFKEELGKSVIESEQAKRLIEDLRDAVFSLTDATAENPFTDWVDQIALAIRRGLPDVLDGFANIVDAAHDLDLTLRPLTFTIEKLAKAFKGLSDIGTGLDEAALAGRISQLENFLEHPDLDPERRAQFEAELKDARAKLLELLQAHSRNTGNEVSKHLRERSNEWRRRFREEERQNQQGLGSLLSDAGMLDPSFFGEAPGRVVRRLGGDDKAPNIDKDLSFEAQVILEQGELESEAEIDSARRLQALREEAHLAEMDQMRQHQEELTALEVAGNELRFQKQLEDFDKRQALIKELNDRGVATLQSMSDRELKGLLEADRKREEFQRFNLSQLQRGIQASLDAVRSGVDHLVNAAIKGSKVSAAAMASIFAEQLITLGWTFQAEAVAWTFRAIADEGKSAYKAVAMGIAAKIMLGAGYGLKAKYGGAGGGGGGSPPASGGGGSSRTGTDTRGRDSSGSSLPETITVQVNIEGGTLVGATQIGEAVDEAIRRARERRGGTQ